MLATFISQCHATAFSHVRKQCHMLIARLQQFHLLMKYRCHLKQWVCLGVLNGWGYLLVLRCRNMLGCSCFHTGSATTVEKNHLTCNGLICWLICASWHFVSCSSPSHLFYRGHFKASSCYRRAFFFPNHCGTSQEHFLVNIAPTILNSINSCYK